MDLDVTGTLQQVLEHHSVHTKRDGPALVAGNMTTSACVFRLPSANNSFLRLDINVNSPLIAGRTLIESFAALGSNEEEAIRQAWGKFCRASLHVLLEVFVGDKKGEDQIELEIWENGGARWRVCLGPLLVLGYGNQPPPAVMCGELIDQLREALLPKATREYHWLRFYYMRKDNSCLGSECLLDNESWSQGESLVNQWKWPDGFYSIRLFLILRPAEP
jgi:hypothetical protein